MVCLAALANRTCLDFDKVANVHLIGKHRPRADSCIGADPTVGPDVGVFDVGERQNHAAGAKLHVLENAMRSDDRIVGKPYGTVEDAIDIDRYVMSAAEWATHIDAGRVHQRDTSVEQRIGLGTLVESFQHRELSLTVHPERLDDTLRL